MWGLVRGNSVGWGSLEVIATLVGGSGLAVAFVAWERRARVPMLPLRLFRSRAFSAGNAAGFLFFATLYGSAFFLAQFLQTALGYGPLGAGLRLLPLTAILFVTAPIAGVLVNRFGDKLYRTFFKGDYPARTTIQQNFDTQTDTGEQISLIAVKTPKP